MPFHRGNGVFSSLHLFPEGPGNGGAADIIMGGTDTARGKYISEYSPARVNRRDYRRFDIRNDPRLVQSYTQFIATPADVSQIQILGSTGKDFIANNNDAGGNVFAHSFYS